MLHAHTLTLIQYRDAVREAYLGQSHRVAEGVTA